MPPLAARQDLPGDFLHGEVRVVLGIALEGGAQHEQRAVAADFVAQELELLRSQVLGRDVDEVALGGCTMHPEDGLAG